MLSSLTKSCHHSVLSFSLKLDLFSVCGLIILVGTAILGRVLCSRKFCADDEQHLNRHRPEACLHACSSKFSCFRF